MSCVKVYDCFSQSIVGSEGFYFLFNFCKERESKGFRNLSKGVLQTVFVLKETVELSTAKCWKSDIRESFFKDGH